MAPLRVCRIVTVPITFQTLLPAQLRCAVARGIALTLVSSPGPELDQIAGDVGADRIGLAMAREPAPASDVRSLMALTSLFRRHRFDLVHSSTPKAGFLTALAARAAGVAIRIHTFTGQPWVELTGLKRRIPRECDRLIGKLNTQCYADSRSQREFLIAEGLVRADRIRVIGEGSISGVDLDRFSLARWGGEAAAATRHELGIPGGARVVVFVGRLTRDKGIAELTSAFCALAERDPDLHLLLVGPFEPERDPLPTEALAQLRTHPRIHAPGFSPTPEKYLAVADVFCLPSYREGFGSVVVEAAALELPAVVTRVTGLVDAVVDGETGVVVPPKDAGALAAALEKLCASESLRRTLGRAGRLRVERDFDATRVNALVVDEYFRLARAGGRSGVMRSGGSPS